NQRVGIGTAAPTAALDVASNSAVFNSSQYGGLGAWSTGTNSLPVNRADITPVAANGYVYVIGGDDGNTSSNTVYYAKVNANGNVDKWVTTTGFPDTLGRSNPGVVIYNGYVYVAGGITVSGGSFSVTNAKNTVYYAKLNTDGTITNWNQATNLSKTITNTQLIAANGYLYLIGGRDAGSGRNGYSYAKINSDGSTGTWSAFTDFTNVDSNQIYESTAVTANGNIYVLGGIDQTSSNVSTVFFMKIKNDGSLSQGFATTSMPAARVDGSGVTANGYVYYIGGYMGGGNYSTLVYYARLNADGTLGTWTTAPSALPAQVGFTNAVQVNSNIYVIGGENSSPALSSVYYTPTARVQLASNLDLIGLTSGQIASASGGSG